MESGYPDSFLILEEILHLVYVIFSSYYVEVQYFCFYFLKGFVMKGMLDFVKGL